MRNARVTRGVRMGARSGFVAGLIVSCGLLAAAQTAPPQKPKDAWPDMPTYDIFSKEEMARDFVTMRFGQPLDKPELGFSLLAPKTWDEVPLTVSREEAARDSESMVTLALLRGAEKGIRIEIAYCRVPQNVEVERFARAYLDGSGLKLLHAQIADFSGRQVFDTLIRTQEYLVRMTFSRHGDKIYLVSGSAPEAAYKANARLLGVATVSFRTLK